MRSVPSDISTKLAMKKQTSANFANPSASIWIGRPTTPLTDDTFLEKQTVLTGASITDTSVAVCHPKRGGQNTKMYIAYVDNGVAKVVYASAKAKMSSHIWVDTGFSEPATSVSIAYDGTMPKDKRGKVEFVTENQPWVFWVRAGAMFCRKLGTSQTITLAEQNCTDVSAIRAMWSEVGSFDFGLVVFFLLSGVLYYRQLIGGEWKDAEIVTFGPSGVTWTSIAAFRTWDYRVGVQGKTSTGDLYELFTQFMGIGKQTVEHIELRRVLPTGFMTPVTYTDTANAEHINVIRVQAGAPYGGLYSIAEPTMTDAYNLGDSDDDWGKILCVKFSGHLRADHIATQPETFSLVDSMNIVYAPTSAILLEDGQTVQLTFTSFNNARGQCIIRYTPGSVQTMAGTTVGTCSFGLTPINLTPSVVPIPTVIEVINI